MTTHRTRPRRPRRPRGSHSPRHGGSRQVPAVLTLGPSNCIWLIACDFRDPVHGHASEAGMWWRFAERSDPAASHHIFRMNGQVTLTVTDAANAPDAYLSTLASAISATNNLSCEDLAIFWHGIHINAAHANTPHRLRNPDEEYYGQVHRRRAPRPAPPQVDPGPLGRDPRQLFLMQNGQLTTTSVASSRTSFNDMFPFNWPDFRSDSAHSGWPGRYDNASYVATIRAMHNHPHVRRFHLYGCDLADPTHVKPIIDLAQDIADGGSGDSQVTDKEIWVYSDFTTTAWDGAYLKITHTRGEREARKGVKQEPDGSYSVVRLHSTHGPLPGWQVRGKIDGGRAIAEKLVINQTGTRGHRTTTYEVQKFDAAGCSIRHGTVTQRQHGHDVQVPDVTGTYTPFATAVATDHAAVAAAQAAEAARAERAARRAQGHGGHGGGRHGRGR
ncbi:MAG: hypothetical protein IPM79_30320 [Polyangiaceae bacterium]|nr:hypothetical protein [Polyangiaceae bacterium]MBK8941782.1 hypothetical protein [Polyangiaceae bacterium]